MMFDYHLEHIMSFTAKVRHELEVIGQLPEGLRANGYIIDGEVTGPKVSGRLRPVGGDWLTVRTDGSWCWMYERPSKPTTALWSISPTAALWTWVTTAIRTFRRAGRQRAEPLSVLHRDSIRLTPTTFGSTAYIA